MTVTEVMTFETTDKSENNEENDAEDDEDTTTITESHMGDIVSISPSMSPDTDI